MTPAEQYRALAARFRAHARTTDNPRLGAEWEHLARCYIRLAEQAERNLDLVYETLVRRESEDGPGGPAKS